jgi:hypothetical protein
MKYPPSIFWEHGKKDMFDVMTVCGWRWNGIGMWVAMERWRYAGDGGMAMVCCRIPGQMAICKIVKILTFF